MFSYKVEDSKLLQKDEKDGSPRLPVKVDFLTSGQLPHPLCTDPLVELD